MRYRRLGKTDVAFLSLIYWLIDFTWQDTHFSNKHYIYIALPVFFQLFFLLFYFFFRIFSAQTGGAEANMTFRAALLFLQSPMK